MNNLKISQAAALLMGAGTLFAAQARTLTLGVSVIDYQHVYRGGQDRYFPLPVIDYDGERFWLHGVAAGAYLWKDRQDKLSFVLTGSSQRYDPDDNDFGDMKGLDKRRMTLMGGVTWRHVTDNYGRFRTLLVGDMLNNSNGILWDLAWQYPFQYGNASLTPSIGGVWSSANHNRYYYGVSEHESARTGIARYHPDGSFTPYFELTAVYSMTQNWHAAVGGRYSRLSSEVKNSPMVDKKSQTTLWAGVSYTF